MLDDFWPQQSSWWCCCWCAMCWGGGARMRYAAGLHTICLQLLAFVVVALRRGEDHPAASSSKRPRLYRHAGANCSNRPLYLRCWQLNLTSTMSPNGTKAACRISSFTCSSSPPTYTFRFGCASLPMLWFSHCPWAAQRRAKRGLIHDPSGNPRKVPYSRSQDPCLLPAACLVITLVLRSSYGDNAPEDMTRK